MQMKSEYIEDMSSRNTGQLVRLRTEDIKPGRYQPRKKIESWHVDDIAGSLDQMGLNEPIVVRPSSTEPGQFELVSGEYRWRAALKLGWASIAAYVSVESDKTTAVAAITANGGLPLDPIEEAEGFARLIDEFEMTHAAVAKACGKGNNRGYVTKAVRMLRLPSAIREWVANESLTATHAQVLLGHEHLDLVPLAEKCIRMGWSTDRLRSELNGVRVTNSMDSSKKDARTIDWMAFEVEMSKTIGLPVEIKPKGKSNKEQFDVRLECSSKLQLEAVLNFLKDYREQSESSSDIEAA